jgi:hypothetical protein
VNLNNEFKVGWAQFALVGCFELLLPLFFSPQGFGMLQGRVSIIFLNTYCMYFWYTSLNNLIDLMRTISYKKKKTSW